MSDYTLQEYIPHIPMTSDEASQFVLREFDRVSLTVNQIIKGMATTEYAEPDKPQKGQQVYAASPWDPGNGDGHYIYDGSGWQFAEADATDYLPLAGGTLTGGLLGTTASFSSTVHATGNITTGGTVDGRDVATDGTKLDGIAAGAEVNDEFASESEAQALSSTTVMMSPKRTDDSIKSFRRDVPTEKTASFTLALGDGDHTTIPLNTASLTVTVPPNSTVAFPIGTQIDFFFKGSGTLTFAEGAGVTILSADDELTNTTQYTGNSLFKLGTNEWGLVGALG